MAQTEVIVPALGEGIHEVTIIKWLKQPGDQVEQDEALVEIATDKVDSEISSPCSGILAEILAPENSSAEVGSAIAIISSDNEDKRSKFVTEFEPFKNLEIKLDQEKLLKYQKEYSVSDIMAPPSHITSSGRFLSPLVRRIVKEEGIALEKLDEIKGSGMNNKINKTDVLAYIHRKKLSNEPPIVEKNILPASENVEIIEMDRMRKLISQHMLHSIQTSAHVSSFIEADATRIVYWRETYKDDYQNFSGNKITYTHLLIQCVIETLKDFPRLNASVQDDKIIIKKNINIGIATALPSGNLIVPVVKEAQKLNLHQLVEQINDLSGRARNNKLLPNEIQGGTFTVTNIGTFGNIAGTPIINQPEVAILALGAISKKPAVVTTEYGDSIGIKQLIILSLTYDHRIIDGAIGGLFLQKLAQKIENFDVTKNF
jgi:2-oxoglutarate dehydrogenase E2 component (dihydrolipoamide succinyltransferase)